MDKETLANLLTDMTSSPWGDRYEVILDLLMYISDEDLKMFLNKYLKNFLLETKE